MLFVFVFFLLLFENFSQSLKFGFDFASFVTE